jgi:succinate dehydrogenase/fumarate reductase flavoprotein subunit
MDATTTDVLVIGAGAAGLRAAIAATSAPIDFGEVALAGRLLE